MLDSITMEPFKDGSHTAVKFSFGLTFVVSPADEAIYPHAPCCSLRVSQLYIPEGKVSKHKSVCARCGTTYAGSFLVYPDDDGALTTWVEFFLPALESPLVVRAIQAKCVEGWERMEQLSLRDGFTVYSHFSELGEVFRGPLFS